ncbi:hypothetical protein [Actinoalloteichus caeruleus]|uniref:WXG100-like domain-containing protein n=1 Tax=Actinoalloteichus cyanogriseus TaxID=2893586 RepID=UPI003BB88473
MSKWDNLIPEECRWLLPIVVGSNWPEGDEEALRRLSQAWVTAADGVAEVAASGDAAATAVLAQMEGETAEAIRAAWTEYTGGGEERLPTLEEICRALAEKCDAGALNVEYTKMMIIAQLVILAIEIAIMIAAAAGTFGGSTAGIPLAQMATREIVKQLFILLVKELTKAYLKKVLPDVVIQSIQMAEGNRQEWDWGRTGTAAAEATADGVVNAVSGGAGQLTGGGGGATDGVANQLLDAAGKPITEGIKAGAKTALGDALQGNFDADRITESAAGGVVSGAVGAASGSLFPKGDTPAPGGFDAMAEGMARGAAEKVASNALNEVRQGNNPLSMDSLSGAGGSAVSGGTSAANSWHQTANEARSTPVPAVTNLTPDAGSNETHTFQRGGEAPSQVPHVQNLTPNAGANETHTFHRYEPSAPSVSPQGASDAPSVSPQGAGSGAPGVSPQGAGAAGPGVGAPAAAPASTGPAGGAAGGMGSSFGSAPPGQGPARRIPQPGSGVPAGPPVRAPRPSGPPRTIPGAPPGWRGAEPAAPAAPPGRAGGPPPGSWSPAPAPPPAGWAAPAPHTSPPAAHPSTAPGPVPGATPAAGFEPGGFGPGRFGPTGVGPGEFGPGGPEDVGPAGAPLDFGPLGSEPDSGHGTRR